MQYRCLKNQYILLSKYINKLIYVCVCVVVVIHFLPLRRRIHPATSLWLRSARSGAWRTSCCLPPAWASLVPMCPWRPSSVDRWRGGTYHVSRRSTTITVSYSSLSACGTHSLFIAWHYFSLSHGSLFADRHGVCGNSLTKVALKEACKLFFHAPSPNSSKWYIQLQSPLLDPWVSSYAPEFPENGMYAYRTHC